MTGWQRRSSYLVLGACALTGVVWFLLADALGESPPQLRLWWVGHGVTGFLAILTIGMALPHHVVATWRHRRNRWLGSTALALLAVLVLSALLLEYGQEPWHTVLHWAHIGIGMTALVIFPLHVLRGRLSVGQAPVRHRPPP